MQRKIIIWVPNKLNFEELFTPSEYFPNAEFSKGKMLIVLSLFRSGFIGNNILIFDRGPNKDLKADRWKLILFNRQKD